MLTSSAAAFTPSYVPAAATAHAPPLNTTLPVEGASGRPTVAIVRHPLQQLMARLGVTAAMTPAEILKRGAEIRRSMTSAAALEDEYDDAYFFGAPFAATSGPSGHDQPTSAWGNHQVIGGSSSSVMTQLPSVPSVNNTWEGGEAASPNTKWQHNNIIQERLRNVVNKVSETKKKPCPFFAQGYCKYGEFCRYSHEAAAVTAEPATTLAGGPNDDSVQQDHQQQFLDEERNEDHCAICLEHPADRFRRFGILPACEHVFCLPCIRTWRKSNNDMNSSNGFV